MGKKIAFIIAFVCAIIILTGAALFFYFDRIAVGILDKAYNIDIAYKNCSKSFSGELRFTDLSVVSRATRMGIISKTAGLKPVFKDKHFAVGFNLQDGNFIKKGGDRSVRYDTLTALVSTPFNSNWKYREIRGLAEPENNGVKIKEFEAISDEIRLSVKGDLSYKGMINSDIVIYFADSLTRKIPPEFANVVLSNEKDGWRSLSVRLSGDPDKPSMQISSKLFRLNIHPDFDRAKSGYVK